MVPEILILDYTMEPDERLDSRQYNLSELQLAYLLDSNIAHRQPKNLEQEIEDTVLQLDKRLQYLVEDICIWYEHGYLNEDVWPNAWNQLSNISRGDDLYNPPTGIGGTRWDTIRYMSMAMHFGHVCRLLYSATAPKYDTERIALGFIIGLSGGWLSEDWKADSSVQNLLQMLPEEDLKSEYFDMPGAETLQGINDVVTEVETSLVATDVSGDAGLELRNRLEESNLTVTPTMFDYANNIFESTNLPATPTVLESIVKKATSDQDLIMAEKAANQLIQDIESLTEKEWRRGEAIQVFWAVHTTDKVEESGDLLGAVDTENQQISKLLKDLKGRDPPWDKRPVIEDGQFEISTTAYGTLIAQLLAAEYTDDAKYTIPSDEEVYEACHAAMLGKADKERQKLLDDALPEVDLDI